MVWYMSRTYVREIISTKFRKTAIRNKIKPAKYMDKRYTVRTYNVYIHVCIYITCMYIVKGTPTCTCRCTHLKFKQTRWI